MATPYEGTTVDLRLSAPNGITETTGYVKLRGYAKRNAEIFKQGTSSISVDFNCRVVSSNRFVWSLKCHKYISFKETSLRLAIVVNSYTLLNNRH